MKRVGERVSKHRTGAAPAVLGSLWPVVAGIAFAWLLQQWLAPAIGPGTVALARGVWRSKVIETNASTPKSVRKLPNVSKVCRRKPTFALK